MKFGPADQRMYGHKASQRPSPGRESAGSQPDSMGVASFERHSQLTVHAALTRG